MAGKAKLVAGGLVSVAAAFGFFVSFLEVKEGTELEAYQDGVKVWTICTGDTHNVTPGMVETPAGCRVRLNGQAQKAWDEADELVTADMTLGQWIAYADYIYNAGAGNFSSSLMLYYANQGRVVESCDAFLQHMKAGRGKVDCRIRSNNCYGVVIRRQQERSICLGGNP
jgi:lysozyme